MRQHIHLPGYQRDYFITQERAMQCALHDGQQWTVTGLVFIDFDGVLHPYAAGPYKTDFEVYNDHGRQAGAFLEVVRLRNQALGCPHLFSSIEPLADLVQKRRLGLVINTSWRTAMTLAEIIDVLPESLSRWVVGKTPAVQEKHPEFVSMPGARSLAIAEWLNQAPFKTLPWAALDDVELLHHHSLERLVATNDQTGLTVRDMKRLAALL